MKMGKLMEGEAHLDHVGSGAEKHASLNSTQQLAELPACFFCRGPAPHTPWERVLGALSFLP